MKKDSLLFTAGEFAKLHNLNKRTLHYYDEIGLFSPSYKGENGYRYYTYFQSAELENILALRELPMSIKETKQYLTSPNYHDFMKISSAKIEELDNTIKKLNNLKSILQKKQEMLSLSKSIEDNKIEIIECKEEYLVATYFSFDFDSELAKIEDMEIIMKHLKTAWEFSTYKTGCGSFISIDKIKENHFDEYDGLFTKIESPKDYSLFQIKPAGKYLCGFSIGEWSKLPSLYGKMLAFARNENLNLTGLCYEMGLNEFAISDMSEYVTQVSVLCTEKT